jgi:hypothetical protein
VADRADPVPDDIWAEAKKPQRHDPAGRRRHLVVRRVEGSLDEAPRDPVSRPRPRAPVGIHSMIRMIIMPLSAPTAT